MGELGRTRFVQPPTLLTIFADETSFEYFAYAPTSQKVRIPSMRHGKLAPPTAVACTCLSQSDTGPPAAHLRSGL